MWGRRAVGGLDTCDLKQMTRPCFVSGIFALFLFYEKVSNVTPADPEFPKITENDFELILLTPLPNYWDYRHTLPCLV